MDAKLAKWLKKLPEKFLENAEAMSTEELKKKIVDAENVIDSTEKDCDSDQKLQAAKEECKNLEKDYKQTTNEMKNHIRVYVRVLQDRGAI